MSILCLDNLMERNYDQFMSKTINGQRGKMRRKRETGTYERLWRLQSRRHLLVTNASVILTTGMVAPTLEAANCSPGEHGFNAGANFAKSALPFLGDRCVQIKPVETKPAPPVHNPNPSRHPTALSGDPQ